MQSLHSRASRCGSPEMFPTARHSIFPPPRPFLQYKSELPFHIPCPSLQTKLLRRGCQPEQVGMVGFQGRGTERIGTQDTADLVFVSHGLNVFHVPKRGG